MPKPSQATVLSLVSILQSYVYTQWRRKREEEGPCLPSWIFIHDIDKIEGGLMVLYLSVLLFRCPSLEIFLPTPFFIVPV